MAATPSIMKELGTLAPPFRLPDVLTETDRSLTELKGNFATVVMFICNHCPYVKHVNQELVKIAKAYQPQGIAFVAISSNDVSKYPEDGPDKMKVVAEKEGYPFPYLFDEVQDVAKAYAAVCTPDFFVYDRHLKLVYRGQLDDSRPKSDVPVTGKDLRAALDAILEGRPVPPDQKPSIGCSIKWKHDSPP